jgi:hypothetical protein
MIYPGIAAARQEEVVGKRSLRERDIERAGGRGDSGGGGGGREQPALPPSACCLPDRRKWVGVNPMERKNK